MGFTKLDSGILRSSIMSEDAETFKVWIALLAACDKDGLANISPVFLESVCRIPIGRVGECLAKLQAPDPNSRSKENDGRRIEKRENGYFVFNYLKYRQYSYSESKEAARKREYRERLKQTVPTTGKRQPTPAPTVGRTAPTRPSPSEKPSNFDHRMANLLASLVLANNPKDITAQKIGPNTSLERAWADQFRFMRNQDRRSEEDIERLLQFSQNHKFWKKNIRSPEKLREQFDALIMEEKTEKEKKKQPPGFYDPDEAHRIAKEWASEADPQEKGAEKSDEDEEIF